MTKPPIAMLKEKIDAEQDIPARCCASGGAVGFISRVGDAAPALDARCS